MLGDTSCMLGDTSCMLEWVKSCLFPV